MIALLIFCAICAICALTVFMAVELAKARATVRDLQMRFEHVANQRDALQSSTTSLMARVTELGVLSHGPATGYREPARQSAPCADCAILREERDKLLDEQEHFDVRHVSGAR